MKTKHYILSLLAFLASINALAYRAEINGIYYDFLNYSASVTYRDNSYNSYSGDLVIPASITYQGATYTVNTLDFGAFKGCNNLTSITIPNTINFIYADFKDCCSLASIVVQSGNEKYDSRNNCNALIETASNTLIVGCKNTIIPNSVTSIGTYAFDGCTGLTSIAIPNSVTSIGTYAFRGCNNLTDIWCYAEEVPNAISFPNYNILLHVPAELLDAYKNTYPWSKFDIIAIGEATEQKFRYYKLVITQVQGEGYCLQFSEFDLLDESLNEVTTLKVYAGTESDHANENWNNVTDNNVYTKYCDGAFYDNAYFLFDAMSDITPYGYRFYTGNDTQSFPDRNPSSWKLYGSNTKLTDPDNSGWVLIDRRNNDMTMQATNYTPYDFLIGNFSIVDLASAKISTSWYADRSMEPLSGLDEMHAVHYQPGNTDRSGDGSSVNDNKVFVFNLLSGFKGGVVKAGEIELTIVFNKKKYDNGITQIGLSGKTYTMKATKDMVSATLNGVTKPVVKLMDTYKNKAGRWIEFQNNDYAKDLLNANPIFNPDGKTTDAFYTEMTLADQKSPIPIEIKGDTNFRVRYLRPIDATHTHQDKAYFKDGAELGYDDLLIAPLFVFDDWRQKYPFGYNARENWVNFYGIHKIYFNLDEVETDREGIMEKLEDPNLDLKYIHPNEIETPYFNTRNEFLNYIGYIRYQNNGGAIGSFNLFIPFHIVHNWGEMVIKVQVPIVGTYDDESKIHWLDENGVLATGIQLNKTSLQLEGRGSTTQLVATVSPSNATNQSVTWRSTNVSVVTVNNNGLVTAIGPGTAQIIATTTDGSNLTASCLITVTRGNTTLGDVNGDGNVNSGDVMSIYSIMAGRSSLDRTLGDVNGDGQVNSGDVMRVYSIMAGKY